MPARTSWHWPSVTFPTTSWFPREAPLRRINGTAVFIATIVATTGALVFPMWSYADRGGTGQANVAAGTVNTEWGR